jgi:hypothetical protein
MRRRLHRLPVAPSREIKGHAQKVELGGAKKRALGWGLVIRALVTEHTNLALLATPKMGNPKGSCQRRKSETDESADDPASRNDHGRNFLLVSMIECLGEAFALTHKGRIDPHSDVEIPRPITRPTAGSSRTGNMSRTGFSMALGPKDIHAPRSRPEMSRTPPSPPGRSVDARRFAVFQ